MSRQDYVRLAAAFAASRPYRYFPGAGTTRRRAWEEPLIAVAVALKEDNTRFDAERFVMAAHEGDPGFDGLEKVKLLRRFDERRANEHQNVL